MAMRIQFQNDMIGKRNQYKTVYKIGAQNSGGKGVGRGENVVVF